MIWTLLSVLVCLALTIKLMFFTPDRVETRWFHRVMLVLACWYAGAQVINFLFHPYEQTSPMMVLLHLSVFVASFVVKAHHLPWNQK